MAKAKYDIYRMFLYHPTQIIRRGLTLEEAQAHCRDPETSSTTCQSETAKQRTKDMGPWFDGYDIQLSKGATR